MSFKHKIDEYLQGELSHDEREAFIRKMKDEPGFAEEVKLHQTIIESIGYRAELSDRINGIARKRKQKKRKIQIGFVVVISLVASFILWIFSQDVKPKDDPIAEILKVEKHHLPFKTKGNESMENTLNDLHEANEHSLIIEQIDSLEDNHPEELSSEMKLYLLRGLSFYKLKRQGEAQEDFKHVIENGDVEYFQPYARYFMALSLIKEGDDAAAQKQLETTKKLVDDHKLLGFPFKESLDYLLEQDYK